MIKSARKQALRVSLFAGLSLLTLAGCVSAVTDTAPVEVDAPPVAEVAPAAIEAAAPAPATFSADGIAALETTMGDYLRDGRLYGIHTRLAHKGEIVSDYYAGLRGLETGTPVEDDTIYRIYSMS